ncbi:MAG: peptidoglycan/xylan/chitin deacetylase (PgdA/CDA1 family) [Polyangiales bacterium]|jgi:peptidoglycan/xylan/chitin deacetylase (PgdA/CDA1 family)
MKSTFLVWSFFVAVLGCGDDAELADGGANVERDATTDAFGDARADTFRDAADDGAPTDAGVDALVQLDAMDAFSIPDAEGCEPWASRNAPLDETFCEGGSTMDPAPFGNRVALTFDDGPLLGTTERILETLRAEEVPATFFALGGHIFGDAVALVREMHEDPLFHVANHGWSHTAAAELGAVAFDRELQRTNEVIRLAVGDPCYFPRYFRFPFTRATCDETPVAEAHGLAISGVDVDSVDWCFGPGGGSCAEPWVPEEFRDDMIGYALARLEVTGGGIMLLHDVQPRTADLLPELIRRMRAAGYAFVSLEDFPNLNASVRPPTPPKCCGGVVR